MTWFLKIKITDQSVCPLGWQPAGDICVKLFFNPTTAEGAKQECAIHGAELVNIVRNEQENKALLNDITDRLNVGIIFLEIYKRLIFL